MNLMLSVREILANENPDLTKAIEEENADYFTVH